jgi:predicted Fe-S protein YdhL (DUF1289 family)
MIKDAVPSPCVNVCSMHEGTGWCEGCTRTLDEIAAWGALDDEGKRAVWRRIAARRAEWRRLHGPEQAAQGQS